MRFLPPIADHESWWIALITFERGSDLLDILSPEDAGAVGWQACIAADEGLAETVLRQSMIEIGLIVLEIDRLGIVDSLDEVQEHDPHLADNVVDIEPGKRTVWGTIHTYGAEGANRSPGPGA